MDFIPTVASDKMAPRKSDSAKKARVVQRRSLTLPNKKIIRAALKKAGVRKSWVLYPRLKPAIVLAISAAVGTAYDAGTLAVVSAPFLPGNKEMVKKRLSVKNKASHFYDSQGNPRLLKLPATDEEVKKMTRGEVRPPVSF